MGDGLKICPWVASRAADKVNSSDKAILARARLAIVSLEFIVPVCVALFRSYDFSQHISCVAFPLAWLEVVRPSPYIMRIQTPMA